MQEARRHIYYSRRARRREGNVIHYLDRDLVTGRLKLPDGGPLASNPIHTIDVVARFDNLEAAIQRNKPSGVLGSDESIGIWCEQHGLSDTYTLCYYKIPRQIF